ncbi:MAG TPA: sugar ABC transporter permease [Solirubrobacteraceae bacterium]|jgi:multiple sugar transport system permease protein|nr:sugar ABC transporter permease [Solirubrobacteraceae bacterium]
MATTAEATFVKPRKRRRSGLSERRLAAAMVSPSLIVIVIVAAYPIIYAIWLSLHQYSVIHPGLSRWVGLDNYKDAVTSSSFWSAVRTTFVFTIISVVLELVIGMGMALLMHAAFRGRSVLRAVVLVPWAILTVGTAIMWRSIVAPDVGFFNQVLKALHLPGANTVWLAHNGYALAVMIFADVWKTAPFMALLLLAGLQVIPSDLYDAAKVDGATAWQRFVRITLPLLKPAILVALIFRTLDALRIFDLPYVLTQGSNGTTTLSLYAYQQLTQNRLIGPGSALSVLTFIIVMAVSMVYIRFAGDNLRQMAAET